MRAARGAAALLALALAAAPAAGAPPPEGGLWGRIVASLSFRGDQAIDDKRMAGLTELAPGKLLTEGAVRISMRNLFATRRFSDLAVEASPSGEGVAVVVVFSAAPRIGALDLTKGIPARGRVLDAVGLRPGDPVGERPPARLRGVDPARPRRKRGTSSPSSRSPWTRAWTRRAST